MYCPYCGDRVANTGFHEYDCPKDGKIVLVVSRKTTVTSNDMLKHNPEWID